MSRKTEVQSYLADVLKDYALNEEEMYYVKKCYHDLRNEYDLDKSLFDLKTKFSGLALENALSEDGRTFLSEISRSSLGNSVSDMWQMLVED